ncbi:MAG: HAMP domain-containing histidine kinase [Alphaproteobacteria bacterium]|nr:HAMP domain-containing histidine kinase [Alphaproteobacteria bacterium]MCB9697705.1 HAMP domain-containing histidine kinase [Alphaproteobacteria bacterium]
MRLSWKINLGLMLAISTVLVFQAHQRLGREVALFENDVRRDHHVMGRALRNAVEDAMEDAGPAAAIDLVRRLDARDDGLRIRYVELDASDPALRPDAPRYLLDPVGLGAEVVHVDQAGDPGWLYTYVPIALPPEPETALELRESLASQQAYIRATQVRIAEWLVLMIAVSWAVVAVLIRWLVSGPIESLIAHARRVGRRDFASRAHVGSHDELGELGRELDQMAAALQAADQRLVTEQEAKSRAVDQLRHADRLMTVGQLAAGVAHELGTPLNVAQARAKMIASWDVDDEEDARGNARTIAEQCDRMTAIIRQLLDFARPRALEAGDEDLAAVARAAVGLVAPLARKRGVSLDVVSTSPVGARVDRGQLQQVLLNLLSNALHATPPDGMVHVVVDEVVACPPAGEEGRFARLCVRDTGAGIPPENLPHVFEPFFTTKDVGEGTGLGLSVSHGIVRDHGGWIEARSELGQGTTFEVYLPPASGERA